MATFNSSLPLDLHKHPAISSSAVLVDYETESLDRLQTFAEKNLPKSWHMEIVPFTPDEDMFYIVMFYGALGSEPADHNGRLDKLGYSIDTRRQRDWWERHALCRHESNRNGDCDRPRQECHDLIDNALKQIRDHNYWSYLPAEVQRNYQGPPTP